MTSKQATAEKPSSSRRQRRTLHKPANSKACKSTVMVSKNMWYINESRILCASSPYCVQSCEKKCKKRASMSLLHVELQNQRGIAAAINAEFLHFRKYIQAAYSECIIGKATATTAQAVCSMKLEEKGVLSTYRISRRCAG